MADNRQKQFTVDRIAHVMISEDMSMEDNPFDENYYGEIRSYDREPDYKNWPDVDVAARMIFLNKTCFNGLYRVNSEGYFNTPMGRNKTINLYEKNNILMLSEFFKRIPEENFMNGSYKLAMDRAKMCDILYIDPPYDYTENDGFTKYQKEGFSLDDLLELKVKCDECLDKEAVVIISNNDTKKVRAAFKNDEKHNYSFYYIEELDTKRMINCKGDKRNTGKEILIVGVPRAFPKVESVDKLIEYIRLKNSDSIADEQYLMKRFKRSRKTVNQMLDTMQYFGIINNEKVFTKLGEKLRKTSRNKINREVRNVILTKQIFKGVFEHDKKDTSNKMLNHEIYNLLKISKPDMPDGIANKRAKSVRVIVDWCLAN